MLPSDTSSSAYSFVLESAEITSPIGTNPSGASSTPWDVTNVVLEIDIFENIEKSYLTGTVLIMDDNSLFTQIGFNGIQTLRLGLRLPEKEYTTVYKKFYIDKVVHNTRATDSQAVLTLHIMEDIGFVSEYINVNRVLEGKGSEIITNIVRDYFDRNVFFVDSFQVIESQTPFKIIVPNLTPVETISWILDRMTAEDGSPFYLYSTLNGVEVDSRDKSNTGLYLKNWQTMISQPTRANSSFTFSAAQVNKKDASIEQQMFVIQNHHDNEIADITTLNESGFVNSKFLFHDVNTNRTYIPGYDQPTVAFGANQSLPYGKRWTAKGMLDQLLSNNRLTPTILNKYPFNGRVPYNLSINPSDTSDINPLLHTRPESRLIAQVFSSVTHDPKYYSYLEGRSDVEHLTKINSKALKNWVSFSPLTFAIPGRLFLNGKLNATIGVKYNLKFTIAVGENIYPDTERSGTYLILAARHVFSRDAGYTVHFTGVKVNGDNVNAQYEYIPPPPAPFTPGSERF